MEMTRREKQKTHRIVKAAVDSGRMIRPKVCSACGKKGRIGGHHADYEKPLEVIWLCGMCHAMAHKPDRVKKRLEDYLRWRPRIVFFPCGCVADFNKGLAHASKWCQAGHSDPCDQIELERLLNFKKANPI